MARLGFPIADELLQNMSHIGCTLADNDVIGKCELTIDKEGIDN